MLVTSRSSALTACLKSAAVPSHQRDLVTGHLSDGVGDFDGRVRTFDRPRVAAGRLASSVARTFEPTRSLQIGRAGCVAAIEPLQPGPCRTPSATRHAR